MSNEVKVGQRWKNSVGFFYAITGVCAEGDLWTGVICDSTGAPTSSTTNGRASFLSSWCKLVSDAPAPQVAAAKAEPEASRRVEGVLCWECGERGAWPLRAVVALDGWKQHQQWCAPCYLKHEEAIAARMEARKQPEKPAVIERGPLPMRYPVMGWNKRAIR